MERVAATDFTVLIEGESGTGKELVARQIHELSRRRARAVRGRQLRGASSRRCSRPSCSASRSGRPPACAGRRGKFEHADGGTLFLDEVSDLSLSAQAKLLRAIQDLAVERVGGTGTRRVNTRIVAATNRPLAELVERGLFRADLFYRLSGVEIHVPPLRASARRHPGTGAAISSTAIARTGELTLSDAARDALRLYAWPGNVRELERLIERAVALARVRPHRARRSAAARCAATTGRCSVPSLAAQRHDARVGQPLCATGLRALRPQQAAPAALLDISYHTLQAYLRIRRSQNPHVRYAAAGMGHVAECVAGRAGKGRGSVNRWFYAVRFFLCSAARVAADGRVLWRPHGLLPARRSWSIRTALRAWCCRRWCCRHSPYPLALPRSPAAATTTCSSPAVRVDCAALVHWVMAAAPGAPVG